MLTANSYSSVDMNDNVSQNDLLDMSLEELLHLKVVNIASLREESTTSAPSIVSVISRQDIDRYGARNLVDIFDRLTNTQVIGSHFSQSGKLSIRAVNQVVDNSTLFMIDGRPLRDGLTSGFNPDIYRNFPVDLIDYIEIIRGPGSVLHGTNAFAGVVNIVLKKKMDYPLEIKVTAGDFGYKNTSVNAFKSGDDYSISIGVYDNRSQGDTSDWIDEPQGVAGSGMVQNFEMGYDGEGVMATGEYRQFKATLWYSDFVGDSASGIPTLPSTDVRG